MHCIATSNAIHVYIIYKVHWLLFPLCMDHNYTIASYMMQADQNTWITTQLLGNLQGSKVFVLHYNCVVCPLAAIEARVKVDHTCWPTEQSRCDPHAEVSFLKVMQIDMEISDMKQCHALISLFFVGYRIGTMTECLRMKSPRNASKQLEVHSKVCGFILTMIQCIHQTHGQVYPLTRHQLHAHSNACNLLKIWITSK